MTPADAAQAVPPAEDVSTGAFGGARVRLPDPIRPCTPEEQAQHLADLDAELSMVSVGDAIRRYTARSSR